ncbi:hypothetical protein HDV64DRAFT_163419 [Trichoderma sp. TUCIM 5745]
MYERFSRDYHGCDPTRVSSGTLTSRSFILISAQQLLSRQRSDSHAQSKTPAQKETYMMTREIGIITPYKAHVHGGCLHSGSQSRRLLPFCSTGDFCSPPLPHLGGSHAQNGFVTERNIHDDTWGKLVSSLRTRHDYTVVIFTPRLKIKGTFTLLFYWIFLEISTMIWGTPRSRSPRRRRRSPPRTRRRPILRRKKQRP